MLELIAYPGKAIKTGEDIYYQEFNKQKSKMKEDGYRTNLADILLTGRDTDLLIIAFYDDEVVGNIWGRLLKNYTHLDRVFIFPNARGKNIAEKLILFMLKLQGKLIWNAVHPATERIAEKFSSKIEIIEGYRGWVLDIESLDSGTFDILKDVTTSMFCYKCNKKVPLGEYCVLCGNSLKVKNERENWGNNNWER